MSELHTSDLPWGRSGGHVLNVDGSPVCVTYSSKSAQREADAERVTRADLIVRRVNAHDELVAALRLYIDAGFGQSTDHYKQGLAYDAAIVAITKATKGATNE